MALLMFQSCDRDDDFIGPGDLPSNARTFIATHFPDATIQSVIKEYDDLTHSYEVLLSDDTRLEFNRKGEWTEVVCFRTKVPDTVVPEKILSYVQSTHPDNVIVAISRDDRRIEVMLDNRTELVFSQNGDYLGVDF